MRKNRIAQLQSEWAMELLCQALHLPTRSRAELRSSALAMFRSLTPTASQEYQDAVVWMFAEASNDTLRLYLKGAFKHSATQGIPVSGLPVTPSAFGDTSILDLD